MELPQEQQDLLSKHLDYICNSFQLIGDVDDESITINLKTGKVEEFMPDGFTRKHVATISDLKEVHDELMMNITLHKVLRVKKEEAGIVLGASHKIDQIFNAMFEHDQKYRPKHFHLNTPSTGVGLMVANPRMGKSNFALNMFFEKFSHKK